MGMEVPGSSGKATAINRLSGVPDNKLPSFLFTIIGYHYSPFGPFPDSCFLPIPQLCFVVGGIAAKCPNSCVLEMEAWGKDVRIWYLAGVGGK